jgi:hypothetical protein
LGIKQKLFAELDNVAKPSTIFASNTSSLAIADIARDTERKVCKRPLCIAHDFKKLLGSFLCERRFCVVHDNHCASFMCMGRICIVLGKHHGTCLSWDNTQSAAPSLRQDRFAGIHFFNPVAVMKLVGVC